MTSTRAFTRVEPLAVLAGPFVLMLVAVSIYTGGILRSSPVELDAQHHLVMRPGCTIPARLLEAEGSGAGYRFTRFGDYRAPDWHKQREVK